MNTDKHTKLRYSPITGRTSRQWLHYADDTFEPIRKNGNIKKKYHTSKRMMDWWVVDKPQDWNPAENGFNVSLNHDYGEEDKPRGKAQGRQSERNNLRLNPAGPEQSQQVKYRQTSLGKGAAGYPEHEARQNTKTEKPKSSTQNARELEKHQWNAEDKEYDKWLQRMKTNPPWKSKEPTPAEKVQSVTHPIGEETGTEIVEQMLKKSGKSWAKAIGHGLKKTGLVFNILANPKDAW